MIFKHGATIDDYLAAVPDQQKRAALQRLREQIQAVVPEAQECIAWGCAAFRKGPIICLFAAAKNFCSFYISSNVLATHAHQLQGFETLRSVIHFQPQLPLPDLLVAQLLQTRLADLAATEKAKSGKRQ